MSLKLCAANLRIDYERLKQPSISVSIVEFERNCILTCIFDIISADELDADSKTKGFQYNYWHMINIPNQWKQSYQRPIVYVNFFRNYLVRAYKVVERETHSVE